MSNAVAILKEEYGITSLAQLNAAIKELGGLDISPFVADIKTRSGDYERQTVPKGKKKTHKAAS